MNQAGPYQDIGEGSFRLPSGHFDEWSYLHHNQDVAAMVRDGKLPSGEEHFRSFGHREYRRGMRPFPPSVREMSYLLRNPDVAASVKAGTMASGFDHWVQYGRDEEAQGKRKPYEAGASRDLEALGVSLETWKDGYVIIPGLFDGAQCDRIVETTQRIWRDRHADPRPIDVDIFLDKADSRKVRLNDAPSDAYEHPHKINNLYYFDPLVRAAVMDPRLCTVLRVLLDGDPVAFTSLNFRKGSEQGLHLDTFYMPPAFPHRMVAMWIALEDVSMENGPLTYVPGSSRIPPYYFDHQRLRVNHTAEEYAACGNHMRLHMQRAGLGAQPFCPRKGDVLIWHALLYHGGSPILDKASTRHSLVAHYFPAGDYPGVSVTGATSLIEHGFGCYYENRPPQYQPLIGERGQSFLIDRATP